MENEEVREMANQKIVRRIIKYDVPDEQKYSDTTEELPFVKIMDGSYAPIRGTTFDEVKVEELMHIDGMHPDREIIPERKNVKPTDEDEVITIHYVPDDVSNHCDTENKETNILDKNNKDSDDISKSDNELENTKLLENNNNDEERTPENLQADDTNQELENEKVSHPLEAYLLSIDIPTKRSEFLSTYENKQAKLIPLHQDRAWLRTIPEVCQILSQFKQIGEANIASGSCDVWYYHR